MDFIRINDVIAQTLTKYPALPQVFQAEHESLGFEEQNETTFNALKSLLRNIISEIKNLKNQTKNTTEEKEMDAWLQEQSSFFAQYPNITTFNANRTTKLIVGHVQSGKSAVICGLAIKNVKCYAQTTIVIVRNLTCDYKQLMSKFENDGRFGYWKAPILYAGDNDTQVLADALKGTTPSIVVALANKSQVERINTVAGRIQDHSFDVILDEADDLGYKKKMDKPYIKQFLKLREKARQTTLVTATCFTIMFKDYDLAPESVYFLASPDNYKGLDYIDTNAHNFGWFTKREDQKIVSRKLVSYFTDLADQDIFADAITIDGDTYNHPIIHLQKGSGYTAVHELCLQTFATHPTLSKSWTCLTFNGKGVMMYSDFFVNTDDYGTYDGQYDVLTIDGVEETKPDNPELASLGVKVFKDVTINHVLQFLRDIDAHGNIFHHINIVTGRLGSRGVNFVSADYHWHLTHQLLELSSSASSDDLIQSIRLFGCYNDTIPLTLNAHQKEINNLRLAYKTQADLLQGTLDQDEKVIDAVPKVPVDAKYVPDRKLCKKSTYMLNKITTDEPSDKDARTGYLSYSDDREKRIYDTIVSVMETMNSGWVTRGQVMARIPEETRSWDRRSVNWMQQQHTNLTQVKWRKIGANYEYHLE